ncbi:MAG: DsbA family protein [Leptolyngbyaceae cyanobacterium]
MSNSSPDAPQSAESSAQPRSKNWPIWLGVGFFGAVGIALIISLWGLFNSSDESPVGDAVPTETAAVEPPADLRAHQALVSEAVEDLGREILVGESPTKGNPEAEIVLLEFSDFQCPYCSQATPEVDAFVAAHANDVLLVFKHFPLTSIHPEALPAALAAWAAGQQEQFWAFHDALFANQTDLSEDLYLEIAADLGLDIEQFNRDRDSEAAKQAVARDLALAQELQLRSTPTFVMDDLLIPGAVPQDFFAEALRRLQAAR